MDVLVAIPTTVYIWWLNLKYLAGISVPRLGPLFIWQWRDTNSRLHQLKLIYCYSLHVGRKTSFEQQVGSLNFAVLSWQTNPSWQTCLILHCYQAALSSKIIKERHLFDAKYPLSLLYASMSQNTFWCLSLKIFFHFQPWWRRTCCLTSPPTAGPEKELTQGKGYIMMMMEVISYVRLGSHSSHREDACEYKMYCLPHPVTKIGSQTWLKPINIVTLLAYSKFYILALL